MALTKLDLKNIGKLIKKNLGILRKEINKDIGNLISDQILPQFDSLNDQFVRKSFPTNHLKIRQFFQIGLNFS